jgi:hypothetical protein
MRAVLGPLLGFRVEVIIALDTWMETNVRKVGKGKALFEG